MKEQSHTRGGGYWSRATERCGEFRCMWIWICASVVWRCRCRGYVEVKAVGSNSRQLCNDVVWRLWEGCIFCRCIFSKQPGFHVEVASTTCEKELLLCFCFGFKNIRILGIRAWIPRGCQLWKMDFLFDFHYLNSLPLERGPFPSINNWHLITYPPHRCRLWSEPCSFISTLPHIDRWADRSTIKGIPRGAVNTRSPHTPGMWSSTGSAHSRCYISLHPSTSY